MIERLTLPCRESAASISHVYTYLSDLILPFSLPETSVPSLHSHMLIMTDKVSTHVVQPHPSGSMEASQWKEYTTDSGRKYWYNKQTKEKSWNAPEGTPKASKSLEPKDKAAEKVVSAPTKGLTDLKNPVKDKSGSVATASKAPGKEGASAAAPGHATSVASPASNPPLKEASPSTISQSKETAKSASTISTGGKTTPSQPVTTNPTGGDAKSSVTKTPMNSTTSATTATTATTNNTTSGVAVNSANPTGSSVSTQPATSAATNIAAKLSSASTATPMKSTATKPAATISGASNNVTNPVNTTAPTQVPTAPTNSSQKMPEVAKASGDHSTVPAKGVAHTIVGDNAKVEGKTQKHHGWFGAINAGLEVLDHAMDLAKKGHDITHPQTANPQGAIRPTASGMVGSTTPAKATAPSTASLPVNATTGTMGSAASAKAPAPSTAAETVGRTASAKVPVPSTASVPAKATPAPSSTPQQHPGPTRLQTANFTIPRAPQTTTVSGTVSSGPVSKGNAVTVAASNPAPVPKATEPPRTIPSAAAVPSTVPGKPTINTTSTRTLSAAARGGRLSSNGQRGAAAGAVTGSGAVAGYTFYQDYQDDEVNDVPPSPPTDSPPPTPPADTPPPSPPADSPLSDRSFGGHNNSLPPTPPPNLVDERDDESSPPSPPADQEESVWRPSTPPLDDAPSSGDAEHITSALQRHDETMSQPEDDGLFPPSPPPEGEVASDEGGSPSNPPNNGSDENGDSPNPSPPESPQVQASSLPPDSPILESHLGQAGDTSDSD